MSLDCVQFAPPKEIHVERIQNGEVLLVTLNFPGLRQSSLIIPDYPRRKTHLFGCFHPPKHFAPGLQSTWSKLIDDKTPSTVMKFGEWFPIQPDKNPVNGDMWLRIFRRRISVMLIPLKQEKNAILTSGRSRNSPREILPVTRYYYWDSGRLGQDLNPRKSEILIVNDQVSLRLFSNGEFWTNRDVELLLNPALKEQLEVESKIASKSTPDAGDGPNQGDKEKSCTDGDFKCVQNNAISEHTENCTEALNTKNVENEAERDADCASIDTNTHPLDQSELKYTAEGGGSLERITEKDSYIEECQGEILLFIRSNFK